MKNVLKTIFALLISAVIFTSCATEPVKEVQKAQVSIDSLKLVEADLYVPAEFKAVQDSLNVAMLEIENQKSKFSLFRSYKTATTKLENVLVLSKQVKVNSVSKKEEVKVQTQEALELVSTTLNDVKNLFSLAPKGKDGRQALEAIQADIVLVETYLLEASELMVEGKYLSASDKVSAASEKANSLKAELEDVTKRK